MFAGSLKRRKITSDEWLNYEVKIGQKFELIYKVMPFCRNLQKKLILAKLQGQEYFKPLDADLMPDNQLKITVEVIKNPIIVTVIIGGVALALGSMFMWFSLKEINEVIEETNVGKFMPIALTVGCAAGILILVKQIRR